MTITTTTDLESCFASGSLVRPSLDEPNLVELVRALAMLAGAGGAVEETPRAQRLAELIGPAEHLVFVLIDGMGMNIVRRLPEDSFFRTHLRGELLATCPSTTACALTSVATGGYCTHHGVTGWFTHVPSLELSATVLPFVDRFTHQPLGQRGLRVEEFIKLPALPARMRHKPLSLTPSYISDTPYNSFSRGGTDGFGYKTITDAIAMLVERVKGAEQPTYAHLYLPDVDTLCHHVGVSHDDVLPLALHLDSQLRRLADRLAGRARVVVTADHGLIDVPRHQQTLLFVGDPLLELLRVPPTGDARMPIFHVKDGAHVAFADLFERRFGDRMALVPTEQAEAMRLFGPSGFGDAVRERFGDFIAFPFKPATLGFHPADKPPGHLFLAVHGGLSADEMRVPLCVA